MSSVPTISVLMPVYNAERYLAEAVESILAQSFGDFEFLITNDGSTDRSLKILQHFAKKDSRIRLISRPNTGYVRALNEMLFQAKGEVIARMDGDDIALPNRFALQLDFLNQNPDVVCVGGAQEFIDEAGRSLFHYANVEQNAEIQQKALTGETPINHPSAMIRKSALLQVGGYDESLCPAEDLDLWLKLGEIGKLANLRETVIRYRQHVNSVSERQQAKQIQQKRRACELAWQRRGIEGQFKETEPWRPIDKASRHSFMLRYGWRFFNSGQRDAAIAYGIRSIKTLPLAVDGWKLLACALIKPMQEVNLK